MSVTHYDPLSSFRFFEDSLNRLMSEPRTGRPWSPAVDILESESELVLRADLPDVNPEEVEVRVENQTLTLKGERRFDSQAENGSYHRIERQFGSFVRSFSVPATFDTENISADYKNGVLTVRLPKKEAAKPRQIKVQVAH